jgi:DNA repair exonuclease SbcCD ATPase subunit
MIIKSLSASFGRLQNNTLNLAPGMNIIEAPNECGKSTWCAFLKAMFYGIRTADRDKAGYLSDKTRYKPWSGVPMAGTLALETNGSAVTLERKSDGKFPMKDFKAFYTGTGQAYPGLTPESAGETLLGVSEAVFERSAYMSQAGIRVTQTPELEKRITALVTTGDESASYTEIDERLRTWLRKRRYNKNGTIPALEEKIADCGRRLSQIEAAVDAAADMRLEAERLQKKQAALKSELEQHDRQEALQAYRRAAEKLTAAKAGYDAIYAELTKNGPAPDESTISALRGELKTLESLKGMAAGERKRLEDARAALVKITAQKNAAVFGGDDPGKIVGQAESLDAALKKLAFGRPAAILLMLVTVFALAAAATALFTSIGAPALLPAALLAAAAGIALLIARGIRLNKSRNDLQRLLSKYQAASRNALRQLSDDAALLASAVRDAEGDVRSAEKSLSSAEAMVEAAQQSLRKKLSIYAITPERAEQAFDRIETLLRKLSVAKADMQGAESYLQAVREGLPEQAAASEPPDGGSPAPRTKQEITAELQSVSGRYEELTQRYNMVQGEIRAMGDPVILGSEKILAEETLAEHRAQYDALSLAAETLKDANLELQSRFSPLLGETAGRIIRRLTAGRYEKLSFDKTLDAFAKTADETVSRHILSLSAGTADQIYLALRLAVCELVLPEEDPCPLILDDALTNFDDVRAATALEYLRELSQSRQILLFTCHGREAALLGGSGVNVIKL